MKKFLFGTVSFLLIAVIIDIACGQIFAYFVNHAKGGDNGRNNYICNKVEEDILVFGSSRAIHHYNPIILSDSLGMSCYNCGQDGNGIILNYGRMQLIWQRYRPKIVIYDVIPGFDLLSGEDNHKYLGWLKAYCDKPGIPEIFQSVDATEKYKMLSQMYRYNSKYLQIIADYIHPMQSDGIKGFRPLEGEMDTMMVSKSNKQEKTVYLFDSLKISYFNKMLDEAGSTRFIFVVSPSWGPIDHASLKPIIDICHKRSIPFLDFSDSLKYIHQRKYFKDGSHLNAVGADEFTRDLVKSLKTFELGVKRT